MEEVFVREASLWRGLGEIPESGLRLRDEYSAFDALKRFAVPVLRSAEAKGCECGGILKGTLSPCDARFSRLPVRLITLWVPAWSRRKELARPTTNTDEEVDPMKISVVSNILEANDRIAAENKALFDERGIYAVNIMSSPAPGRPPWWRRPSRPSATGSGSPLLKATSRTPATPSGWPASASPSSR